MRARFAIAVPAFVLASVSAEAAELSGVVADAWESLPGAEVVLVDAGTSVVLARAYSGADGGFTFTVAPGRFNIGAFKTDYRQRWVNGVVVGDAGVSVRLELTNKAFTEDYSGNVDSDCE